MDHGIRIVVAGGVLAVGIAAATVFRQNSHRLAPAAAAGVQIPPTRQSDPQPEATRPYAMSPLFTTPPKFLTDSTARDEHPPPAPPIVVAPVPTTPTPDMSGVFPQPRRTFPAIAFPFSAAAPPTFATAPTHRVVDGDTLASIAERYLGDAARAEDIFALNRDRLPRHEVLPIGVELKLPAPADTAASGTPSGAWSTTYWPAEAETEAGGSATSGASEGLAAPVVRQLAPAQDSKTAAASVPTDAVRTNAGDAIPSGRRMTPIDWAP